jgi:hypothetical protein
MSLNKDRLSLVQDQTDVRIVIAAVPIFLSEVIADAKPTVVYADEILLSGDAKTAGHAVSICCRHLDCAAGSLIDTSGKAGEGFPAGSRRIAETTPGANGPDGDDGTDGNGGGAITIQAETIKGRLSLYANGGNGGRSQDGGNGRPGAPGRHGENSTIRGDARVPADSFGGKGGKGGAAGLPGHRKAGGNGGNITVEYVFDAQISLDDLKVDAGQPGAPAAAGTPGAGGPGGKGGFITRIWSHHLEDLEVTTEAQGGPQGDPGDYDETEIRRRQAEPGSATPGRIAVRRISSDVFAKAIDGPFLEFLSCVIEDEYRSKGTRVDDSLRGRLEFLLMVCAADPAPTAQKRECLARAFAMARRK